MKSEASRTQDQVSSRGIVLVARARKADGSIGRAIILRVGSRTVGKEAQPATRGDITANGEDQ